MSKFTITLRLTRVNDIQHIGEKGFRKIEVEGVVQPEGQYTNYVKVIGKNEMADQMANLVPGNTVGFECAIDGRLWEKEEKRAVFIDLTVLSFRSMGVQRPSSTTTGQAPLPNMNTPAGNNSHVPPSNEAEQIEKMNDWSKNMTEDENDLPF